MAHPSRCAKGGGFGLSCCLSGFSLLPGKGKKTRALRMICRSEVELERIRRTQNPHPSLTPRRMGHPEFLERSPKTLQIKGWATRQCTPDDLPEWGVELEREGRSDNPPPSPIPQRMGRPEILVRKLKALTVKGYATRELRD